MSILTTTIGQIMVLFSFIFLGFFVAKLFIISFLFNLCMVFLAVAVVKAVFPSIFLGVFSIFPMTQNIIVTTICALAMPLGLSTIVIPGGYGKDTSVAAGMAIVSHLFSAVTIPIVFYLMINILL